MGSAAEKIRYLGFFVFSGEGACMAVYCLVGG